MGHWSWSCDGSDFDNDGTPEIVHRLRHADEQQPSGPDELLLPAGGGEIAGQIRCARRRTRMAGTRSTSLCGSDYSWAGPEPNVFYARRAGRYYDFSGVSGIDCRRRQPRVRASSTSTATATWTWCSRAGWARRFACSRMHAAIGARAHGACAARNEVEPRRGRRAGGSRRAGEVGGGRIGLPVAAHQTAAFRSRRSRARGKGARSSGRRVSLRKLPPLEAGFALRGYGRELGSPIHPPAAAEPTACRCAGRRRTTRPACSPPGCASRCRCRKSGRGPALLGAARGRAVAAICRSDRKLWTCGRPPPIWWRRTPFFAAICSITASTWRRRCGC